MNSEKGIMDQAWEQRKYPRRSFERAIGVLCRGQYSSHKAVDLGEGGLGFQSDLVFPEGASVVLSFQIPGGRFTSLRAQIIHSKKSDHNLQFHGCTFESIKFEQKREIRSFVSARK